MKPTNTSGGGYRCARKLNTLMNRYKRCFASSSQVTSVLFLPFDPTESTEENLRRESDRSCLVRGPHTEAKDQEKHHLHNHQLVSSIQLSEDLSQYN